MDARLAVARVAERPAPDGFAQCLLTGLGLAQKAVPCKCFYDDVGSHLFDAICEMPEYYQTRTETALLAAHAEEVASLIGPGAEVIEFGAGSLRKARILLDAMHAPRAYTPIDISGDYLLEVTRAMAADYPALTLRPLVADFTADIVIPSVPGVVRRAGFFPGSTIGNFRPDAAMALLRKMRIALRGGGLLVGVDLVKDPARLHAAYNDAAGHTAAFNMNLLSRANRELGAGFDLDAFMHYAPYNVAARRIEMYLVSLKRQNVRIAGRPISFAEGEAVHTEDSHKYTVDGFRELATRAGFVPRAAWCDRERLFSMHWLES